MYFGFPLNNAHSSQVNNTNVHPNLGQSIINHQTSLSFLASFPKQQEKEKVEQASAEQRIAMLEQHRMDLVRKKREIEAKLAEVRARFQQPPPEQ
jgi:hypothetical protein